MKEIHFCGFAGQPDIQIFCTGEWTQPEWNQNDSGEIYLAENGMLYTFMLNEVTCLKCLEGAVK